MSIINISVDTDSRQAALTVDGIIVPVIACHLSKGIGFDGEPFLHLSYVVEIENNGGLLERREFILQDPDEDEVFASKILDPDVVSSRDKIQTNKDIDAYMRNRRK